MKDWTIFKTLGASNYTDKEREGDDFYATDPKAIDILLDYEEVSLPRRVWEPSCGTGCLSERLRERGFEVVSTDLIDRGYGKGGVNFFAQQQVPEGVECIPTAAGCACFSRPPLPRVSRGFSRYSILPRPFTFCSA